MRPKGARSLTLRSKSYLFLLLVLALGVISGLFYSKTKYSFGLDVSGGVELTYRMLLKPNQLKDRDTIRGRLINIMDQRARGSLGVAEPTIVPKGDDQIVIELPGATNIEAAKDTIGSSAKIQFYWARNVDAPLNHNRLYTIARDGDQNDPSVSFKSSIGADAPTISYKDATGKVDPRYQAIIRGWELILEGEDLQSAKPQTMGERTVPSMVFSREGAVKMERWSRAHPQDNLAAVLDGKVLSIAATEPNTILSDNCYINGQFSPQYVTALTDLLNGGALPVDLEPLSSQKVDPTIGAQALHKMVAAGLIAFGAISLFMLIYYAFPGFLAIIALGLYVLFTLTVLKIANATFSLAAIAGFILSVGMAVDANILVFERFKEEVKRGKSLASAIDLGFRRALPAIFDSNACTVLVSLVLGALGTGPVKGFANTLIMGVIISLFTAITVSRSLLVFAVNSGLANNPKWYAVNRNWFKKIEEKADTEPIRVVDKPKPWFVLSAVSIALCLPFIFMGGLKPNVEFRGGFGLQYKLGNHPATSDSYRASLDKLGLKGSNVKFGGEGATRFMEVTAAAEGPLKGLTAEQAEDTVGKALGFASNEYSGSDFVGPAIQSETEMNAIYGVILSCVLIICWLALRFGVALGGFVAGLRFGGSAILALVHDVLFVIGVSAVVGYLEGWEISALFITSMLTVIGFSVHDTIVIFDRIRENLHHPHSGDDLAHLMNRSISQSFSRSLNTSMTVVLTLFILLFFGTTTPELRLFCATMLAGIVSGTYSSIFNASPILYIWDRAVARKKGEGAAMMGSARQQRANNQVIQTNAPVSTSPSGRSYGQVRRRANAPQSRPGHIEIEEDL